MPILPGLSPVAAKSLTATFDAGRLSSDGGLIVLREIAARLPLAETITGPLRDDRDPTRVRHSYAEMATAPMLMIAAGYEDCDDVDALRTDPALKIAVGRCPETGADLMSQPTLSRLENLDNALTGRRLSFPRTPIVVPRIEVRTRMRRLQVNGPSDAAASLQHPRKFRGACAHRRSTAHITDGSVLSKRCLEGCAMRSTLLVGVSFAALVVSSPSWADAPPPSRRVAEPVRSWGWEVGGRYWYSTGETNWNHNGNAVAPILGNPASVLTYDGLDAHSGEVFFRGDHLTGFFVKGYAGIGKVVDGSLDDEDYFVGQVKFSDTYSEQRDGRLGYLSADIGFTFYDSTRVHRRTGLKDAPREGHGFRLGGFVGYHHWNEKVHAFGIRCNPDDIGGAFCGPPGAVVVPFTTNVISNEVEWDSLRIGLSGEARLTRQLKVAGEVAWVPYARMKNEDSHHLRADLGPVPNILHDGSGSGVMLEGVITYDLTRQFSIGVGGRYWHLESDGNVVFGPTTINTSAPLNKLESERYGAFVQGSLKF